MHKLVEWICKFCCHIIGVATCVLLYIALEEIPTYNDLDVRKVFAFLNRQIKCKN